MLNASGVKIWRPRQLYVGEGQRDYVDLNAREQRSDMGAFDAPSQVSHGGDSRRNKLAMAKDKGDTLKARL
jgi:citrate synthase